MEPEKVKLNAADEVVHYFQIQVKLRHGTPGVEYLVWSNLRWELRCKYDWYFKYRAALLQVKYPKHTVVTSWGHVPAVGKTLVQIVKGKVSSKKGKLTGFYNKLNKYKATWSSMFPIEDDLPYIKALEKIKRTEFELLELEKYFKEISE